MLTKSKILTTILLVFAILVLINFLGDRWFFRLDFTEDQRYTLSDATKSILETLEEPVSVTAYFSEPITAERVKLKRAFESLLEEYDARSGGAVVYDFVDPLESEETEREAMMAGMMMDPERVREALRKAALRLGIEELHAELDQQRAAVEDRLAIVDQSSNTDFISILDSFNNCYNLKQQLKIPQLYKSRA